MPVLSSRCLLSLCACLRLWLTLTGGHLVCLQLERLQTLLDQEKQTNQDMESLGEELLKDKQQLEKEKHKLQTDKDRQVEEHTHTNTHQHSREHTGITLWVSHCHCSLLNGWSAYHTG